MYSVGKPLSIVMAAGPYTTSDNLDYEALKDLLLKALESQPDVLILTGPFVDVSQDILKSGDIQLKSYENDEVVGMHSATYEMVFIECVIRDCIASMYLNNDRLATHIILVPSLHDAHHEFVFPQPPFGDRDEVQTKFYEEKFGILNIPHSKEGDRKRVHLMPNPCMFRYGCTHLFMHVYVCIHICLFSVVCIASVFYSRPLTLTCTHTLTLTLTISTTTYYLL